MTLDRCAGWRRLVSLLACLLACRDLPLWNVEVAGQGGIVVALGWSGSWKAKFTRYYLILFLVLSSLSWQAIVFQYLEYETEVSSARFAQGRRWEKRSDHRHTRHAVCLPARRRDRVPRACTRCEKRHSLFESSLCLSRACLGKMIVFEYTNGSKMPFFRSGAMEG